MDYAHYQPAPQVLNSLNQIDFAALVGPTAVGKTTLIKAAVAQEPRLHMLVAGASRAPRPDEQEGVDFHFGTLADMSARANNREYVTVVVGATSDLYTTALEDYAPGKTTIMAVLAHAMPVFRALPYRSFHTIFVVPPDVATWHERLNEHSFTPEQLAQRLREAEISLSFALEDYDTRFLVNDDLAAATKDLITLALGEPLPPQLQADQSRGRHIAGELLNDLRQAS
jgi:guanylate kinase